MIRKKLLLLPSLVLTAVFGLSPLAGCKPEENGLKKLKVSEVTHSIFYAPMY